MNTRLQGWLIVNKFLNLNKFNEIYHWLQAAAQRKNVSLELLTNADILLRADDDADIITSSTISRPDFVLFWDKDIRLAQALEAKGLRLFNSSHAIEACDDKSLTSRLLLGKIKMPVTYTLPFTYDTVGYTDYEFLSTIEKELPYPFVVKECFGSFGAQVYLVNNREETIELLQKIGGKPIIIQEFIKSSAGRDIRIHVIGGKVVTSMLRYNDNDFRANITNGGSMKPYTPTAEQAEMAILAADILKLDFAGVDILFSENDEPILCEVNSNAHFKNIYDCNGVNVADYIIDDIILKCS